MNRHTLAAVVLAALLVSVGGVAAAPGNAPADAPIDGSADAPADGHDRSAGTGDHAGANETADRAENANGNGTAASERDAGSAPDETPRATDAEGPVVTLPDRVPDHVSGIHDLVRQFRAGDLGGSLGEAISGLTGDDTAAHTSG